MLLDNGRRVGDYQLVVRKFVKRDEGYFGSYSASCHLGNVAHQVRL